MMEVKIPMVYTRYRVITGAVRNFVDELNYCPHCNSQSRSLWVENIMTGYGAGGYSLCPKCGNYPENRDARMDIDITDSAPLSMLLQLRTTKNEVRLVATGKQLSYNTDTGYWKKSDYTEKLIFDLKDRTTVLHMWHGREQSSITLGNPMDTAILTDKQSHLRHIGGHQGSGAFRKELIAMQREMRLAITERLEQNLGHKVKSLHVPYSRGSGFFWYPVFNYAFRIICPDAQNIDNDWRDAARYWNYTDGLRRRTYGWPVNMFDADTLRRAPGTVQGMINSLGLPDRPWVRRELSKDIFSAYKIFRLTQVFHDSNCAMLICQKFTHVLEYWGSGLKQLVAAYGEAAVLRYAETRPEDMKDTARMLNVMLPEHVADLIRKKPRLRELHDMCTDIINEERHPHVEFDNDDPIRRRLAMQTDMVKFFLPKASEDLCRAGATLCNCVGGYVNRVNDKHTNVVLVTDDRGKLVACIEVAGGKLIQAKLKHNRRAHQDPKINAEVIAWADKMGINYKDCDDVREIRLPAIIRTA